MGSNMPIGAKLTIMAYISTYYAIGAGWLLTIGNYFVMGWFAGYVDQFYLDSFAIYFGIVLVFSGLGNIALAVLRYRTGEKGLIASREFLPFPSYSLIVPFRVADANTKFSLGKFQMGPSPHHLPGRYLPPYLASFAITHVRN
jgi:hypothetical protein